VCVEVFPAFNYAQDKHTTEITDLGKTEQGHGLQRVTFRSKDLALELNATIDCGDEPDKTCPRVKFEKIPEPQDLGDGITATFTLTEGQAVSFILRDAEDHSPDIINTAQVDELQLSTQKYWARWIQESKYTGRWEEVVTRSLLLLKMLTFEPSGAIVAAPTFSLPEDFGGMFLLFLALGTPWRSSRRFVDLRNHPRTPRRHPAYIIMTPEGTLAHQIDRFA
jgi:GH15 family glucan-1,4-alpha-glucosidase